MQLIKQLEATRDQTLQFFALGEADLARTYAADKWSVRFVLLHLADSETVFFERIRRVLSEPRQVVWFYDQDAWAARLDYATAPGYQTALRSGIAEATAAGHVLSARFGRAATIYRDMLISRADDARLRLSYGEALLGDSQFATACAEFEKLKGKGLGPRDLGLPAARACMLNGDPDAAIAWLRSIPSRFLPVAVRHEAVFAPLQSRADFLALFPAP